MHVHHVKYSNRQPTPPIQQSRIPHIKISCHNKHGIREQVTVNTLKLINRRMFGNWNINNDYLHALGK